MKDSPIFGDVRRVLVGGSFGCFSDEKRIFHAFPFVEKTRVNAPNDRTEINFDFKKAFRLGKFWNILGKSLIDVHQIAEEDSLSTVEVVFSYIFRKGKKSFYHFTCDGFWPDIL